MRVRVAASFLTFVLLGQVGCGVKTDPVPYVRAYPERQPKTELPEAPPQEEGKQQ